MNISIFLHLYVNILHECALTLAPCTFSLPILLHPNLIKVVGRTPCSEPMSTWSQRRHHCGTLGLLMRLIGHSVDSNRLQPRALLVVLRDPMQPSPPTTPYLPINLAEVIQPAFG